MSSTTPAGWYPDPEREGATRWWDGQQWAPSQDAAPAGDDRFRPRDGGDAGQSGTGSSWEQQDASSGQGSQEQAGQSWGSASTPAADAGASAPAWQQQETPSWQQPSTPAWQQQDAQPAYGQSGAQQWNQYDAQPKKSRTGLFVGIGAGVLVLLLLLVGGGIWAVSSFVSAQTQVQTQGGGTQGGGTQGGGTQGPGSFQVTVAQDSAASTQIDITTAGTYEISVESRNGEDPRIELTGNGQSWSDDDGGDGLDSLLTEYLDVGTYTLLVEEYSGDPLVAQVTITQR